MTNDRYRIKRWARWLGTCIGFPLAGVAARVVAGNIDDVGSAVLGGLAGGAVLGLTQAVIGGVDRIDRARWIGATAAGLGVGLGIGSTVVAFRTDTPSVMAMGAISGACVGLAQAISVPMRMIDRILWVAATPMLWAGGWFITSHVIVDLDRQHAMFGGPGAITAAALAGVLFAIRRRGPESTDVPAGASTGSAVAR
jgi:hypothetical protein